MSSALYSRGMPANMRMLAAYLAEEERKEAREIYIGNALWSMLKIVSKNIQLPSLSEMMHEDRMHDDRTGAQIMAGVLEWLKK